MPTRREMLNAAAALMGASLFGVPASRAGTQVEDAIREKTRGAPIERGASHAGHPSNRGEWAFRLYDGHGGQPDDTG